MILRPVILSALVTSLPTVRRSEGQKRAGSGDHLLDRRRHLGEYKAFYP